jgi:hypothetical protein
MAEPNPHQAGTNIYFAPGGVEDIDFTAPVAFLPAGHQTVELPVGLAPGGEYTVVARSVSAAGVEERSMRSRLRMRIASDGLSAEQPLAVPTELVVHRLAGGYLCLGCSIEQIPGERAPEAVEVFVADDGGTFDTADPIATASVPAGGSGDVVVSIPPPALPCRLSVRSVAGGQAGRLAQPITVAETAQPAAPVTFPQETS